MSKINLDPAQFALAVIQSVPVNGDSPETIAKEKLDLYLAAYEQANNFINKDKSKTNPLERAKKQMGNRL